MMIVVNEFCGGKFVVNYEGGYFDFYVLLCGFVVIEEFSGIEMLVWDFYGGIEYVVN